MAMFDRDEAAFRTATPLLVDEGALTTIALPHDTRMLDRDMPRASLVHAPRSRSSGANSMAQRTGDEFV
jgi:hypothetical protein